MKNYDIKSDDVIKRTAEKLKQVQEIKAPEWSKYVKTSVARERPPTEKDWWYTRTASILKKIQKLGPIGTNKLSKKYGGKKNRGHKPEKTYNASTKIIRTILQQLEKAGLTEQTQKGTHKGRVLTKKGISLLNKK